MVVDFCFFCSPTIGYSFRVNSKPFWFKAFKASRKKTGTLWNGIKFKKFMSAFHALQIRA